MTGNLFIFEGPDGVGKTTIVKALKDKFAGDVFEFLSFPGREEGTLGHVIYRIHHNRADFGIGVMSELALQALHVAAHVDVIETRIRPWITEGKNVVLDRFWWSTIVYGTVGGGEHRALIDLVSAEQTVWGDIKPTIAFLIDRDSPIDRNEDPAYWQQLRSSYARLADREREYYKVCIVDNTGLVADSIAFVGAQIAQVSRLQVQS